MRFLIIVFTLLVTGCGLGYFKPEPKVQTNISQRYAECVEYYSSDIEKETDRLQKVATRIYINRSCQTNADEMLKDKWVNPDTNGF